MEGGEILDLQKIGLFLKELRKEQKLTQEQLAEKFNVSRRTVSRWENGNNLPDLDILIDMSDFYQVDLREILDGERKNEQMNKETEAVVLKAVDYTNTKTEGLSKRVRIILFIGVILLFIAQTIKHTPLCEQNTLNHISDFAEGAASGLIILGIFLLSSFGKRVADFKQRILGRENNE